MLLPPGIYHLTGYSPRVRGNNHMMRCIAEHPVQANGEEDTEHRGGGVFGRASAHAVIVGHVAAAGMPPLASRPGGAERRQAFVVSRS
jgi:hypothetical protein